MKTPVKALSTVFAISILNSIGFGIMLPVMPQLVVEITGEGIGQAAQYGGWLMFAYAVMQFFFAPIVGNLSDRFGRRIVLLVSLVVFSVDFAIMGFAPTIAWLFAGRIFAGIAAATNSTTNAYIADISSPDERPRNFGLMGAAFGAGFVFGPVIGGFLGEYGSRVPFFAAALLGAINFVFTFFFLDESLPVEKRRPFVLKRANPLGALKAVSAIPVVYGILIALFLYNLGHYVLPATWSYYTIERFNWTPKEIGYSLGFVGTMMIIVQGYLTGVVIPRIGAQNAAFVGLVSAVIAYVGYAVSPLGWMLYMALMSGALSGFTMPATQSIMTGQVAETNQGELQGAISSANALTAVVGPPVMTQLFSYFSSDAAIVYLPGAAFLFAAVLTVVSILILLQVFSKAAISRET